MSTMNERLQEAAILRKNQDLPAAIEVYQEILKEWPEDGGVLVQLGDTLMANESYLEAIDVYKRVITLSAHLADAVYLWIGRAYKSLGDWTQAEYHLKLSYERSPQRLETVFLLGLVSMEQKAYEPACHYFRQVLQIKPTYYRAQLALGQTYARMKNNELALEAFKQTLTLKGDCLEAYEGMAHILTGYQRWDDALYCIDSCIGLAANRENLWLIRADIYIGLKEWARANVSCEKALAINPKSLPAALKQSRILAYQNRLEEAQSMIQDLLQESGNDPQVIQEKCWLSEYQTTRQRLKAGL